MNLKKLLFQNTDRKQTVAKNAFWLTIGEVSSRLLRFAVIVYAARTLGAGSWGTFSYALSVGTLIMTFSDLGISTYITRQLAQQQDDTESISTALTLRIGITCLNIIGVILIGPLVATSPINTTLLFLIAGVLGFDSLREICFAFNRGLELMQREAFSKILSGISIALSGFLLLGNKPSIIALGATYFIASFVGCIVSFIPLKKLLLSYSFSFNSKLVKTILITSISFALIGIIGSILSNTDVYMIGLWKPIEEVGYYAASQRLYQFIIIIPVVISTALFPTLSRYRNDREAFLALLKKALLIVCIISFPLVVGGIIIATPLINLILGSGFIAASPIFSVLMMTALVAFPSFILANAAIALDKQKILIFSSIICAILNILFNMLTIPRFGAAGAAFSTLIASIIGITIVIHRIIPTFSLTSLIKLGKPFLALIAMTLVCLLLKKLQVHVLLIVALSGCVYAGLLALFYKQELKNLLATFSST